MNWNELPRGKRPVLQFKQWLEHSYREKDIPEYFFLAFEWRPEELKQHRLVGVSGISESPSAISRFINDGCVLVLDGKETEKINDLSRVLYNNPHYMASKGFDAAKRVMDWNDEKVVMQLIERLLLMLSIPTTYTGGWSWETDVRLYLKNKVGPVTDLSDFVKKVWKHFTESDFWSSLPKNVRPDFNKFLQAAQLAAKRVFSRYSDEEEWRVKPSWRRGSSGVAERIPVFNIPYKSILMVCDNFPKYNLVTKIQHYSDLTGDIEKYKLKESYEIYFYEDYQDLEADLMSYGRRW